MTRGFWLNICIHFFKFMSLVHGVLIHHSTNNSTKAIDHDSRSSLPSIRAHHSSSSWEHRNKNNHDHNERMNNKAHLHYYYDRRRKLAPPAIAPSGMNVSEGSSPSSDAMISSVITSAIQIIDDINTMNTTDDNSINSIMDEILNLVAVVDTEHSASFPEDNDNNNNASSAALS